MTPDIVSTIDKDLNPGLCDALLKYTKLSHCLLRLIYSKTNIIEDYYIILNALEFVKDEITHDYREMTKE